MASSALARLLGVRLPIVQAPMAGGMTTPRLVAAVSEAGALGSLGVAALAPDAIREQIRAVRALTDRPFAVNLFAPLPVEEAAPAALAGLRELLAPHREALGLPEPEPPRSRPWTAADQLAVVVEERVPVFSFTFGIPPLEAVRETGAILLGTATSTAEAVALERAGVDAVVAQGAEAGGHRGFFLEDGLLGLVALVPQVVDAVSVPVLAAGGIVDGRGIAAALALGAAGAQLGTAFLFAAEAGTTDAHRRALRAHPTAITRAGSGRPARGALTPFLRELGSSETGPLPYPLQSAALADLRAADPRYGFYLGGQGAALARELPAAELVAALEREAGS